MNDYFVKYDAGINYGYAELLNVGRNGIHMRILSNDMENALRELDKTEGDSKIFGVGCIVDIHNSDLNTGYLPKVENVHEVAVCRELVYSDVIRKNQEEQYRVLSRAVSAGGNKHEKEIHSCMTDLAFNMADGFTYIEGRGYNMYAQVSPGKDGSMIVNPVHVELAEGFFSYDTDFKKLSIPVTGVETVYFPNDRGRAFDHMEPVFDQNVLEKCSVYATSDAMAENREHLRESFEGFKTYISGVDRDRSIPGDVTAVKLRPIDAYLDKLYSVSVDVSMDELPRKAKQVSVRGNEFDHVEAQSEMQCAM